MFLLITTTYSWQLLSYEPFVAYNNICMTIFRAACRPFWKVCYQSCHIGIFQVRLRSQRARAPEFLSEAELTKARTWAANLTRDTIPRVHATVRFDRSSGKGGQHVNTYGTSSLGLASEGIPLTPVQHELEGYCHLVLEFYCHAYSYNSSAIFKIIAILCAQLR